MKKRLKKENSKVLEKRKTMKMTLSKDIECWMLERLKHKVDQYKKNQSN